MSTSDNSPQVALVTGASRGIGAAIALQLAQAGFKVFGTATTPEGAERISHNLSAFAGSQGLVLQVNDAEQLQAVVDGVTTLNPGDPATVGVSFDGTNVRFTFDIPRGNDGSQGQQGNDGGQGPPGNDGAQGPPFAQAVVDGVTTLDPGQQATVQTSFDGSNVRFQFGIPRGNDGSSGTNGSDGAPGEVSNAQLNSAISGTSNNTNGVSTLDTGFADPDMEALRQKLNEMILNGRR